MLPREIGGSPPTAIPSTEPVGRGETIARLLLTRSPLGSLVARVARMPASVHTKLLGAFLLITLVLIAMGAMSLQTITSMSRQTRRVDEARERVDAARRIEHAVGVEMNATRNAVVLRDQAAIDSIVGQNTRFTDALTRLEGAAPAVERETIQQIRAAEDQLVRVVSQAAHLLRTGEADEAMALQLSEGTPLYREIATLITRVVRAEETEMREVRRNVEEAQQRAILVTVGFAAGSIALALVLGFVISWSFIIPVRAAGEFLGQVAKGNFVAKIDVLNRDELGALAARMNAMSHELRDLYEAQRALNVELRQASKAKSDFLASMSHELRTPLNAILGFNEMILGGLYGDISEEIRGPLTDIQSSGKHLLRLINNVLDLSKIEAGRMELALADYSVQDVALSVITALRPLAVQKGLDLVAAVPDDVPIACGDGGRITQCVMNLVGNALKFTREGRVEIAVNLHGEDLYYRVMDTGIGIATRPARRCLRRVPAERSDDLGRVRRHRARSEHHEEVRRDARRTHLGRERARQGIDLRLHDSRARGARGHRAGMKTILHVEDNELNRKIIRDLLRRTSYRLIEAVDGEAGVAAALEHRPDLILMDVQLPKVSGIDAVRTLARRSGHAGDADHRDHVVRAER